MTSRVVTLSPPRRSQTSNNFYNTTATMTTTANIINPSMYHAMTPTRVCAGSSAANARRSAGASASHKVMSPSPCCTLRGHSATNLPHSEHHIPPGVFAVFCESERDRRIADLEAELAHAVDGAKRQEEKSTHDVLELLRERDAVRKRADDLQEQLEREMREHDATRKTFEAVRKALDDQVATEVRRTAVLHEELARIRDDLAKVQAEKHGLEGRVVTLSGDCERLAVTITDKNKEIDGLKYEREQHMASLHELKERLRDRDDHIVSLNSEVGTQKSVVHGLHVQLEEATEKLNSVFLFRQTMHEVQQKWKTKRKLAQSWGGAAKPTAIAPLNASSTYGNAATPLAAGRHMNPNHNISVGGLSGISPASTVAARTTTAAQHLNNNKSNNHNHNHSNNHDVLMMASPSVSRLRSAVKEVK
eukprot:PhM_4_TR16483/c0_g1_i1/m.77319